LPTITASRIYKGQLNQQSGEEQYHSFEYFPDVGLVKVSYSSQLNIRIRSRFASYAKCTFKSIKNYNWSVLDYILSNLQIKIKDKLLPFDTNDIFSMFFELTNIFCVKKVRFSSGFAATLGITILRIKKLFILDFADLQYRQASSGLGRYGDCHVLRGQNQLLHRRSRRHRHLQHLRPSRLRKRQSRLHAQVGTGRWKTHR